MFSHCVNEDKDYFDYEVIRLTLWSLLRLKFADRCKEGTFCIDKTSWLHSFKIFEPVNKSFLLILPP